MQGIRPRAYSFIGPRLPPSQHITIRTMAKVNPKTPKNKSDNPTDPDAGFGKAAEAALEAVEKASTGAEDTRVEFTDYIPDLVRYDANLGFTDGAPGYGRTQSHPPDSLLSRVRGLHAQIIYDYKIPGGCSLWFDMRPIKQFIKESGAVGWKDLGNKKLMLKPYWLSVVDNEHPFVKPPQNAAAQLKVLVDEALVEIKVEKALERDDPLPIPHDIPHHNAADRVFRLHAGSWKEPSATKRFDQEKLDRAETLVGMFYANIGNPLGLDSGHLMARLQQAQKNIAAKFDVSVPADLRKKTEYVEVPEDRQEDMFNYMWQAHRAGHTAHRHDFCWDYPSRREMVSREEYEEVFKAIEDEILNFVPGAEVKSIAKRWLAYVSDGGFDFTDDAINHPKLGRGKVYAWNRHEPPPKGLEHTIFVPTGEKVPAGYGDVGRPVIYLGEAWTVYFRILGSDYLSEECYAYFATPEQFKAAYIDTRPDALEQFRAPRGMIFVCSDWCERNGSWNKQRGIDLHSPLRRTMAFWQFIVGPVVAKALANGKEIPGLSRLETKAQRDRRAALLDKFPQVAEQVRITQAEAAKKAAEAPPLVDLAELREKLKAANKK